MVRGQVSALLGRSSHPVGHERFANVEISLDGHGHHAVDTAGHGDLGDGEDEGGGDGLHLMDVPDPEVGDAVEQHHSCLEGQDWVRVPTAWQTSGWFIIESSTVYERKSYQEEDVKYRETLEDVWEAGLEVHRLVIEDKQTSDVPWRLTVGLTINVASTNYSKDWYDKNENALQDEADHSLDTIVVALEIVLRKVAHSALFYLQRELFCLDPHNTGYQTSCDGKYFSLYLSAGVLLFSRLGCQLKGLFCLQTSCGFNFIAYI